MKSEMNPDLVRVSKFLSLVLRHQPEKIGITLDPQGWVQVETLIAAATRAGVTLTPALLHQIVRDNDKQRFALSEDGQWIRANQGHSVAVALGLEPQQPPDLLYHGTATRFLASIRAQGLLRRSRQHVHLSATPETAMSVGQRHGRPAVLTVAAGQMHQDGLIFYRAANGVWLTEHVPACYLTFPTMEVR
jgi:putative RNA 2'-phosphotransferase